MIAINTEMLSQVITIASLLVIVYFVLFPKKQNKLKQRNSADALPTSTKDKTKFNQLSGSFLSKFGDEEEAKILTNFNASDFLFFYGNDSTGNSIILKICKTRGLFSPVWLRLQLTNGCCFTLTDNLMKKEVSGFESNCLKFENLVPYSRWRISFAGILEKTQANEAPVKEFVKFNFLWIADSNPIVSKCALGFSQVSYEQFGSLFGQLTINNKQNEAEVVELNLPGSRQREFDLVGSDSNPDDKERLLFTSTDGHFFQIHLKNNNGNYGNLRKPSGVSSAIDWMSCSHNLSSLSLIPRACTILFRANNEIYTAIVYFKQSSKFTAVISITSDINLNGQRGCGELLIPNPDIKPSEISKPDYLTHSNIYPSRATFAIPFENNAASNLALSGGKGASLALLNSILMRDVEYPKFLVPAGFIITSTAFDSQFDVDALQSVFQMNENNLPKQSDSLQERCERIQQLISNCEMKSPIKQAIVTRLEILLKRLPNDVRFAVRSSAIEEDGIESSSAGQNETFLGLQTEEEVLNAVKLCWASLYSLQSVQYRRQNLQNIFTKMAVVVQVMVPSESSGVLFTKYPTNGDPTKILISANNGLGESVVSGEVEPDTFIVARDHQDNFQIASKQLGSKKFIIEMDNDKSTIRKVEQNHSEYSLDDKKILHLARLGVYLEERYGSARDIEWAVYKGDVYLLQARPITSLNNFSEWELLHEFDSPVMTPHEMRTTANVGEIFIGAVTPLTQSVVVRSLDRILSDLMNQKHSDLFNNIVNVSQNHVDLDVYKLFLSNNEKDLTLSMKIYSLGVFGHEVFTEEMLKRGIYRFGIMSVFKKLETIATMAYEIFSGKATASKVKALLLQHRENLSKYQLIKYRTSRQLVEYIEESVRTLDFVHRSHSQISKSSLFAQIITLTIMTEGSTDLHLDHGDLTLILESCNDAESAEIPKTLKQIARTIHAAGLGDAFREVDPLNGVEWLKKNCAGAFKTFQWFIKKHGHRCLRELELVTESWGMAPHQLIPMIQNNLKNVQHLDKEIKKKILTDEDIVQKLQTPKSQITRKILKKFLPLCRATVQRREESKSSLISCVHDFKKAFRHLGKLMQLEGYLTSADLIFYLTLGEIKNIISGKDNYSLKKALRRQKMFPKWDEIKFPELMFGLPKPIDDNNFNFDGQSALKLLGTSVQSGIVRGRACVLKSFAEVDKIQFGDILITNCTDIGWSPYFPMLGGLVTELGGLISHGAVVAREYGLPCVVGAANATNCFTFGDEIILNADKGVITKVE